MELRQFSKLKQLSVAGRQLDTRDCPCAHVFFCLWMVQYDVALFLPGDNPCFIVWDSTAG